MAGDFVLGRQSHPWPVSTAAAPVREGGEVVAALSVVAPSTGFADAGYGPAVRATARALSRRLTEDRGAELPGAGSG